MHKIEAIVDQQIHRWNLLASLNQQGSRFDFENEKKISESDTGLLHPVICISSDLGSGAGSIIHSLSEQLHYDVYDKALLDLIAADLRVERKIVESLDETARNNLEVMLKSWLQGHEIENDEYIQSLYRIMHSMTRKGAVILVGRGASLILKNHSGINVYITAPLDLRVSRLMEAEKISYINAREKAMESDARRAKFIRKYFKTEINSPVHYDLCINTDRISFAAATELIIAALKKPGYSPELIAEPVCAKT